MKIQATEITEIIKQQIGDFQSNIDIAEVGTVIQAGDGIARVFGLEKALAGEMLDFPHDVSGMVLNLEEDNVGVVLFGNYEKIAEGDTVKRTGRIMSVPVGDAMIGRVVNALGEPIDGRGAVETGQFNPIERLAPRHCAAPARARAAPDRPQGHRRHDAHRPRPTRTYHWRPSDR